MSAKTHLSVKENYTGTLCNTDWKSIKLLTVSEDVAEVTCKICLRMAGNRKAKSRTV